MKPSWITISLIISLLLGLGACSQDKDGKKRRPPIDREAAENTDFKGRGLSSSLNTRLYRKALSMVEQNQCAEALPLLRCVAPRPNSFEGMHYLYGYCLLQESQSRTSPDEGLNPPMKEEGLLWINRAAHANWISAQQDLVKIYSDGEHIAPDAVKAQMWLTILENNPMRRSLGVNTVSAETQMSIAKLITDEEYDEALQEASLWQPQKWQSEEALPPTDECRALMKSQKDDMKARGKGRPKKGKPGGKRGPRR